MRKAFTFSMHCLSGAIADYIKSEHENALFPIHSRDRQIVPEIELSSKYVHFLPWKCAYSFHKRFCSQVEYFLDDITNQWWGKHITLYARFQ